MHVLLDERKVRNLPLLRVLVEPGYASKVGSTDLEAKSEGIGVRFIPHADERDPELMVVLHAVERPIIRTIIASRFKEAVEFSFPPALDHVFDLPLSVLTGRETDRIVDHPRIVTVDLSFVAVECVPKIHRTRPSGKGIEYAASAPCQGARGGNDGVQSKWADSAPANPVNSSTRTTMDAMRTTDLLTYEAMKLTD